VGKKGKLDSVVRSIVKDLVKVFKNNKEGVFELPEDLYPEIYTYSFTKLESDISVSIELVQDETVETIDVDGDYYDDESLIDIVVISNPKKNKQVIYELIGELNELIRHELEHLKQFERGYEFPDEEPSDSQGYYTQKHELDALRKGFKRRSKLEGKKYDELIRNWFKKNYHEHKLTENQEKFVIDRILEKNEDLSESFQ
jgi:hypothetical protein